MGRWIEKLQDCRCTARPNFQLPCEKDNLYLSTFIVVRLRKGLKVNVWGNIGVSNSVMCDGVEWERTQKDGVCVRICSDIMAQETNNRRAHTRYAARHWLCLSYSAKVGPNFWTYQLQLAHTVISYCMGTLSAWFNDCTEVLRTFVLPSMRIICLSLMPSSLFSDWVFLKKPPPKLAWDCRRTEYNKILVWWFWEETFQ